MAPRSPIAADAVGANRGSREAELLLDVADNRLALEAAEAAKEQLGPYFAGSGDGALERDKLSDITDIEQSEGPVEDVVEDANPELAVLAVLRLDVAFVILSNQTLDRAPQVHFKAVEVLADVLQRLNKEG